ncbi:MAG: hypothetical protein ABI784_03375 [Ginsengibacter sp.]
MKNKMQLWLTAIAAIFIVSCSSTKNATDLSATNGHLAGNYTITDIQTDIPSGFKITDAFDAAPYENFKGSKWELVRNGKGSFTLPNGTKEDIYWGTNGKGNDAQFQFKKLNGAKARNVTDGYKLQLQNISTNRFVARSPVDLGNGKTGYITYTFTKS